MLPIHSESRPFHTYLWKIASRCNLNCSYCYVYNSADQRWRRQPKLMSKRVATQVAHRMVEHLTRHGKRTARIVFHGGEPLMGGRGYLEMLLDVLDEAFNGSGVELSVVAQSNGILFTPAIGDLAVRRGLRIGVSIDGPPEVHDRYRVDHQGRPTSAQLEESLAILLSPTYRPVFAGFLCVIDLASDPVAVMEHLLSYEPHALSLLLPLNNHDDRPPGKQDGVNETPYADWLIACFDYWWRHPNPVRVTFFDSILSLRWGGHSSTEALGLDPVDIIAIETNGEIEGVDSLKSAFDGASWLGFDVFRNDFDEVARHPAVAKRRAGLNELCGTCRECALVETCGGGYLPHRYSEGNGFDNPSVYCADLKKIILHINETVRTTVRRETRWEVAI